MISTRPPLVPCAGCGCEEIAIRPPPLRDPELRSRARNTGSRGEASSASRPAPLEHPPSDPTMITPHEAPSVRQEAQAPVRVGETTAEVEDPFPERAVETALDRQRSAPPAASRSGNGTPGRSVPREAPAALARRARNALPRGPLNAAPDRVLGGAPDPVPPSTRADSPAHEGRTAGRTPGNPLLLPRVSFARDSTSARAARLRDRPDRDSTALSPGTAEEIRADVARGSTAKTVSALRSPTATCSIPSDIHPARRRRAPHAGHQGRGP